MNVSRSLSCIAVTTTDCEPSPSVVRRRTSWIIVMGSFLSSLARTSRVLPCQVGSGVNLVRRTFAGPPTSASAFTQILRLFQSRLGLRAAMVDCQYV